MDYNERKLVSDFTGLPMVNDPKKDQSPERFSTIIDKVWETWKIGKTGKTVHKKSKILNLEVIYYNPLL